jgi:hypothetical protein
LAGFAGKQASQAKRPLFACEACLPAKPANEGPASQAKRLRRQRGFAGKEASQAQLPNLFLLPFPSLRSTKGCFFPSGKESKQLVPAPFSLREREERLLLPPSSLLCKATNEKREEREEEQERRATDRI